MNKSSFVSVVMPVYNCAQYLRESIDSILKQTFRNFEFIIINDGSTDMTPEILNEYENKDSRIKIINQTNRGIVAALNKGLFEAKGEWIFRMDGDDVALPHRFAVQIEAINKNPRLVLLGGWCQQINSQGTPLKINKYPTNHDALVRSLETLRPFFPHPTACFRRDIIMQLGGYRERFSQSQDTDLWLRLVGLGEFACCEHVVLQLRKHEDNVSNLQSRLQQLKGVAALSCYFRRKVGISDPSQMDEEVWQKFLEWVEKWMEEERYFRRMEGWLILRTRWYANPQANKLKKAIGLVEELINNSLARKTFWDLFRKENFARRLAEESRKIL